ncbi:hypothetical protein [Comamonas endophytica]|uniref:Uncharacterized protein n=1 Tax=Comamonas endophytica TaxID=2949090 RepID=A0ABY6GF07_9BURK|nr:hypothetical protein [Acidovorax sp. 5MLIR]UYG53619.1 hypothetical protein M9799_19900 [Acidovorax sp. 5MLIR]UYG53667.1 hypothetical protein M9799_17165 [Acidovorax sp. 5MLIR]
MFSLQEASRLLNPTRWHAGASGNARAGRCPAACGIPSGLLDGGTNLLRGAAYAQR